MDILFPPDPFARAIEDMTLSEISGIIPRANYIDEKTLAPLCYQSEYTRTFIWHIKYKGNMKLAQKAAEILYDELAEFLAEAAECNNFKKPLLIPIPISKARWRERGYNQAEEIGKRLARLLGNQVEYMPHTLKKIKDTQSQARTHSRHERLENLRDCFNTHKPDMLNKRNVLLLDDVITTGATTTEAIKVLRKAGVKKIIRVALAH
ncbi:MAG: phosphoribosyltransferase family protein [Candidatus Paceibacterota bacterium]